MGHHCHSANRNNVARLYSNEQLEKVVTEAMEVLYPDTHSPAPKDPTPILYGWALIDANLGDQILGYILTKDELKVNLLNESQYSNVGDYEWTLYGDKKAIETFLADYEIEAEIEPTSIIHSWW